MSLIRPVFCSIYHSFRLLDNTSLRQMTFGPLSKGQRLLLSSEHVFSFVVILNMLSRIQMKLLLW